MWAVAISRRWDGRLRSTYHEPGNILDVRNLKTVIFITGGPLRYLIVPGFLSSCIPRAATLQGRDFLPHFRDLETNKTQGVLELAQGHTAETTETRMEILVYGPLDRVLSSTPRKDPEAPTHITAPVYLVPSLHSPHSHLSPDMNIL